MLAAHGFASAPASGTTAEHGDAHAGQDEVWSHLIGEASEPMGTMARVDAPRGLRLRKTPAPDGETIAIMPFDTLVHAERRTTHGWCYVVALGDARGGGAVSGTGFVEEYHLALDPPEPGAHLHWVAASGEMLKEIAALYYKPRRGFEWGEDAKLYVEAIWEANRGRSAGLYRNAATLSWFEALTHTEEAEKTLEIWRSVGVKQGHAIWIPSSAFVDELRSRGAVSSGSISHEAWQGARAAVGEIIDWATYGAGFAVGTIEGAYAAVRDLVMGAAELAGMVYSIAKALVTEGLGALRDFGKKLYELFDKAPELLAQLGESFAIKWTNPDSFARGGFHGEVTDYILMQTLIVVVTMGSSAAVQVGGKLGKVVQVVRALDTAADPFAYASKLRHVAKLTPEATGTLREALGKADNVSPGQRPEIRSGVKEDPEPLMRGGLLSPRQQQLATGLDNVDGLGKGLLEVGKREVTATDLAALTKHSGVEHAMVILRDKRRVLVKMDSYRGGQLPADTKTLLMHSHPSDRGSGMAKFISAEDVEAIKFLNQNHSYMVTVDGTVYRFTQETIPMTIGEVVRRPHPIYVWVQS